MLVSKTFFCIITAILVYSISSIASAAESDVSSEDGFSVDVRYFEPTLTFKVQSNAIQYNGGSVDFKNDLGLSDKGLPEYRINFGNDLRLSYMNLSYSGNKTLSNTLTYQGTQYTASTPVESNLDMTYIRATWSHHITQSDSIETNWLIDLKGFKFDSQVSGNLGSGAVTSTKSFSGVVPTMGLSIASNLDASGNLKFTGEISGLPLGKYGSLYDSEIGLKYKATQNLSIIAGYRNFNLQIKDPNSSENGQFKFIGPYFGINGNF